MMDHIKEIIAKRVAKELNDGDWVTFDKIYATDIKNQNGGKVFTYKVKVKDLLSPKDFEQLPSVARFSSFQYLKN